MVRVTSRADCCLRAQSGASRAGGLDRPPRGMARRDAERGRPPSCGRHQGPHPPARIDLGVLLLGWMRWPTWSMDGHLPPVAGAHATMHSLRRTGAPGGCLVWRVTRPRRHPARLRCVLVRCVHRHRHLGGGISGGWVHRGGTGTGRIFGRDQHGSHSHFVTRGLDDSRPGGGGLSGRRRTPVKCRVLTLRRRTHRQAGVAQLVEQLIRNQQVVRSIRIAGSKSPKQFAHRDLPLVGVAFAG